MLNKKGHIGTMMMFFGALILVGVALFSFATFSDGTENEKTNLNNLVSEFEFKQKYIVIVFEDMVEEAITEAKGKTNFEEEFEISLKQIAERRRNPEISNLFGKIINEPLEINGLDGNYFLIVEGVFAEFEKGESNIRREINFEIEFNENGIIPESL
tara:strand:- start:521 stop:991 length:471 start_codon:yes stop_codon:yes gene_type:complete